MNVLKEFFKEYWIPAIIAAFWVLYNAFFVEGSSTIVKIIANAGSAFFLISWFGNQIFRIKNQLETNNKISDIVARIENATLKIEEAMVNIEGYSTGGESFCYLDLKLKNGEFICAVLHKGQYPLFDVTFLLKNLNNPKHEDVLNIPHGEVGEVSPDIAKLVDLDKKGEGDCRFEINKQKYLKYTAIFCSRNGSFEQDIRLIEWEGKWYKATRVRMKGKIVYTEISQDYPLSKPFE